MAAKPQLAWRPGLIVLLTMAAALLLASWLLAPMRTLWDRLDLAVFSALNGSLAGGGAWSVFWSLANWRPFDAVGGGIILLLAFIWLKNTPRKQLHFNAVMLVVFAAMLISTNILVQLFQEAIDYHRYSPSLVVDGAVRLSDQVTWIDMKDSSKDSFPGDHAFVIFCAIAFFWVHAGRKSGLAALVLLVPLILPRLVGGAHWLTDITAGAVPMTLFCCALWFGTLFPHGVISCLHRWTQPLFRLFERRWLPSDPQNS
jgi:membrane-associated phospholipid phosphatase